jgi:hypothetical protein
VADEVDGERRYPAEHEPEPGKLAFAARLLIGILGVAALVIGLRAAWVSDSATAALIVGAVLLLAALVLGTDWEELTGRFRDASVTVKRSRPPGLITMDEMADLLRTAASDETVEGEPTEELELLRARVRELSEAAAEAAEFDEAELDYLREEHERTREFKEHRDHHSRYSWEGRTLPHNRPPYPQFTLSAAPDGKPRLTIPFRWWGDWRILCEATPPEYGGSPPPVLLDHYMSHGGSLWWYLTYPDDFRWVNTLVPGTYVFKWFRVVVGSKRGDLVEEDEFEITTSMLDKVMASAEKIGDPEQRIELPVRRRYGPNIDASGLSS